MKTKMCAIFTLCFLVNSVLIESSFEEAVEVVEQSIAHDCFDVLLTSLGVEVCSLKRGLEDGRNVITVGNIPEGYSQYLRDIKHQETLDLALQAYKIKTTGFATYGLAANITQKVDKEQFRLGVQGAIKTLELLKQQEVNLEDQKSYTLALAEAEGGIGMMQQSEIVLNARDMFKKPWGCC